MTLHKRLTEEIRSGPSGPKIGAFFDLDQTLLAGFSALAFFRQRLLSGRIAPRELSESALGALSFALGRTGFSGFMAAAASAYRGLSERALEEVGEEVFLKHLARQIYPESRALVDEKRRSGDEQPYEHLARRKDGTTFPVEVRGKTLPYKGRTARVTAIRDITERKKAELELRDSE